MTDDTSLELEVHKFSAPTWTKDDGLLAEDGNAAIGSIVVEMTGEAMSPPSYWGFGRVGVISKINSGNKAIVEFKPNVIKIINATDSSFIVEGGELKRATKGFFPMIFTIGKIIDDIDLSAVKVELNMSGRHYYKK